MAHKLRIPFKNHFSRLPIENKSLLVTNNKIVEIFIILNFLLLMTACGNPATPVMSTHTTSADAPRPSNTPESQIIETPIEYPILKLEEISSEVLAFPGPEHYEGDLISFQINSGTSIGNDGRVDVTLQLDNQEPYQTTGTWDGFYLYVLFDTAGLTGEHSLSFHAEKNGATVDEYYSLTLLATNDRPSQETNPTWVSTEINCCVLHYISGTAAARDIDLIAATVQEAADEFDEFSPQPISEKFNIFFIDRMWYNGAFGWPEGLVISYTDRNYGPAQGKIGLKTIVRHEVGHAVYPFFSYGEGLSVFLASGHYKPESIPERAAASLALGYDTPERGGPMGQHEIQYLHQAALVDYIVETYGWDTLQEFINLILPLGSANREQQDTAYIQAFGITQEQLNQQFYSWLQTKQPGDQVTDLELTVQLQELRREYQEKYTPDPEILLSLNEETAKKPEFVHIAIREAHNPANIATELLIKNAQNAILDGKYDLAQTLIDAIESIVTTGALDHPLANEYANIVYTLANQGYETVSLDLFGGQAEVQATKSPPELETLELYNSNGEWDIGTPPADWEYNPTETPIPTNTVPAATPTTLAPTQMPLPDNTLYFDDFSDLDSGWDQYSDIKAEIGYLNNQYRIWIDTAKAQYWFDSGKTFADVQLETELTITDGPDVNSAGLVCRLNPDTGDMIQFLIDGQGRYGIIARQEFQDTYLGADGMQFSDAIHPIGEPNKIQAVCNGDMVSLRVNGVELLTAQSPIGSTEGRVGVFVNLTDNGIEALYDYFLATDP